MYFGSKTSKLWCLGNIDGGESIPSWFVKYYFG